MEQRRTKYFEGKKALGLVWLTDLNLDLVIYGDGAVIAGGQEPGRQICSLQKILLLLLLGSCWYLLMFPTVFPMCRSGAGGFPVEELMTIAKEKSLVFFGAFVRAYPKGSPGHFHIGVPWPGVGVPSVLKGCCVLWSAGYYQPHVCMGNLSFCPKVPWHPSHHPWHPSHHPAASLLARPAFAPRAMSHPCGGSGGSCVLGCVCKFGL